MKLAYIAGPYRAKTIYETKLNIQAAEKVASKYWKLGYAVICPHKNSAFFDGILSDADWLKAYLEILNRCDCIIMMKNWKDSKGSVVEHEFARCNGIKVRYDKFC